MVQYIGLSVHQLEEHSPALLKKPRARPLVRAHRFTETGAKSFSHQGYPQKILGVPSRLYCLCSHASPDPNEALHLQLPGAGGVQPPDCVPDLQGAGHLHGHQAHHCLLRGEDSR